MNPKDYRFIVMILCSSSYKIYIKYCKILHATTVTKNDREVVRHRYIDGK